MIRRDLIKKALSSASAAALWNAATAQTPNPPTPGSDPLIPRPAPGALSKLRVLIIGAGFGGTTAAKYLSLLSQRQIQITLIEPDAQFVSCPLSNLVLGGSKQMEDITFSYNALQTLHGVRIVKDWAYAVEPNTRIVKTAGGAQLPYDALIIAPGVELMYESIPGLAQAKQDATILQAWSAGKQTTLLREQLLSIRDGDNFVITVPELPYRCPPGPYERASQVAHYFKHFKPRSKVLVLDANQDITSKGPLFKKFWQENYPSHIEYFPEHKVMQVDSKTKTLSFEIQDDLRGAVLNVLPPMRAGAIAVQTGLANINKRWCEVDFLSFESTQAPSIYVLGDAIQAGPYMPKSAHMANAHAKVAAAAIVCKHLGYPLNPQPFLTNTCYSFVDPEQAIYIASVHQYDPAQRTFKILPGAGGLSLAASTEQGRAAFEWAKNIWSDCLS